MHEVLVNRLGGLSLPRKSVVRLTDRPDMTLDVYRGCKITMQQQQQNIRLAEAITANYNASKVDQVPMLKMNNLILWRVDSLNSIMFDEV